MSVSSALRDQPSQTLADTILQNGGRILDQLGVLADLEDTLIPNRAFIFRDSEGKFLYEEDAPTLTQSR